MLPRGRRHAFPLLSHALRRGAAVGVAGGDGTGDGQDLADIGRQSRVRGGMTGWAQVNGLHGDTSIRDRARFDNHYVEYWSPWWDAVIVARTAGVVLREATRVLIQPGGNR